MGIEPQKLTNNKGQARGKDSLKGDGKGCSYPEDPLLGNSRIRAAERGAVSAAA